MTKVIAAVFLLLAGAWFGIGDADAACTQTNSTTWSCDTAAEAAAVLPAITDAKKQSYCLSYGATTQKIDVPGTGTSGSIKAQLKCNPPASSQGVWQTVYVGLYANKNCAGGTAWDEGSLTCKVSCPGGAQDDPLHPGQCLTNEACEARNPGLGTEPAVRNWTSRCVAGCTLNMDGPAREDIAGETFYRGTLRYSGTCPTNDPPPTDPNEKPSNDAPDKSRIPEPPKCKDVGGLTVCVKPNGEKCVSMGAGRSACWTYNQIPGEKTDGPTLQKACVGTSCPAAPSTVPPTPGDTFTKGDSVTGTTTTNTTTSTTTITNYTTVSGGPAGGGPDEGGDGDLGGAKDGTCGGEGQPKCGTGTATGGETCDKAPWFSGGDAALQMVATQAWATKCAVEAGNAAKITGDIGDCKSAFSVDGDNANAVKLRAMRVQICGAYGEAAGTEHDATGEDITAGNAVEPGHGAGDAPIGSDGLDTSGFGFGQSCPEPPSFVFKGHTFTFDSQGLLCEWMTVGGWFVLLLTGLVCAKLLSEV